MSTFRSNQNRILASNAEIQLSRAELNKWWRMKVTYKLSRFLPGERLYAHKIIEMKRIIESIPADRRPAVLNWCKKSSKNEDCHRAPLGEEIMDFRQTLLHDAIYIGDPIFTAMLIAYGADPVNALAVNPSTKLEKNSSFQSLLHGYEHRKRDMTWFTEARIISCLDNMIQIVNVNEVIKNGCTLLHLAIHNKLNDLVQYLINHGANLNAINNYGETCAQLAITNNIGYTTLDGETVLANADHIIPQFNTLENHPVLEGYSLAESNAYPWMDNTA